MCSAYIHGVYKDKYVLIETIQILFDICKFTVFVTKNLYRNGVNQSLTQHIFYTSDLHVSATST